MKYNYENSAGVKFRIDKYVCVETFPYKHASIWGPTDNFGKELPFVFEEGYVHKFIFQMENDGETEVVKIINGHHLAYVYAYWEYPDTPGHCAGIKREIFERIFKSFAEYRDQKIEEILNDNNG